MPHDHEPFDTGISPEDLRDGRARPLQTPWGELALYPHEGGARAASAWCPHLFGPLIEGTRQGEEVTCPWHLWTFSLADGRCVDSPKDQGAGSRLAVHGVELGPGGTFHILPPTDDPSGSGE